MTFRRPFVLAESNEELPAGVYRVETDEELLQAEPGNPGLTQTMTIDPDELEAALKRDQASAEFPVGTNAGQEPLTGA